MWKTAKLKDVCTVFTDGDWIETKDQSGEGIRLVQTGNVKTGSFADRNDKARYISEETFKRLKCTEVTEGDILVSRLPEPVGRACVIPKLQQKAITAVDCTLIRTNQDVSAAYLNYYMQSPQYFSMIQERVTGATRQRISRKNLGEVLVSIPPLAEQQRIVDKLDAAFAEVDRAIDATTLAIEQAKIGLGNLIDEKTSNRDDWKEYKVADLGLVQTGNTPKTSEKANYGSDIAFIKPPHFRTDGTIEIVEDGLSVTGAKSSRKASANSVMMVCIGATIGKVAVCHEEVCFNQQINSLSPATEYDAELIYWQMRGTRFQREVRERAGQATLPIISKAKWANLDIYLPSSNEAQVQIRNQLRRLSDKTEEYCSCKASKIDKLQQLKSALLAQELQPPQREAA